MRFLGVDDNLQQFLLADERFETAVEWLGALFDNRSPVPPGGVLRPWKQFSQQLILGAHHNIYNTIAQPELSPAQMTFVQSCLSVSSGKELDITIHGLARRSFHNNVNGHPEIWGDNLSVATQKSKDLLLRKRVRYLGTRKIKLASKKLKKLEAENLRVL